MSSEKGNIRRSRQQKYQNVTKFQNDRYDNSKLMKMLNSMVITSLCKRCESVIRWKIDYKKYKPLTVPRRCLKCEGKSVKKAYYTICENCSEKLNVCAKCGMSLELKEKNDEPNVEDCSEDSYKEDEPNEEGRSEDTYNEDEINEHCSKEP